MINTAEIEKMLRKMKYPRHCIHCEGIDESVENPVHHPSYEISNACNLNCIFCYSKIAEVKGRVPKPGYYGSLDPRAITISQYGEPFIAGTERVVEIIRKLRDRFGDVRIDIQTNGTLLDPTKLGSEADIVMISLDAGSREKYVEITGADFFDRVVKNIEQISEQVYTVVRTVFMPGVNDKELESIAKIASIADELFLQPLSIYRESEKLVEIVEVDRVESIGEFLEAVYRLSNIAEVRIPGCMLLNIREFLEKYDTSDLMLIKRNAFGKAPVMQREWRFRL